MGGFSRVIGAALLAAGIVSHADAQTTPSYNWNGIYLGYNFGYFDGRSTVEDLNLIPLNFGRTVKPQGKFQGFTAGFNHHLSTHWVVGFELDVASGKYISSVEPTGIVTITNYTSVEAFGTTRLRLGYAWDRFLLYGTGGFAVARVNTVDDALPAPYLNSRSFHVGWTIGAGLEYALLQNWSAKFEYLYSDLGGLETRIGPGAIPPFSSYYHSIDLRGGVVRVGLNYRFDDRPFEKLGISLPGAYNRSGPYVGVIGTYGQGHLDYTLGIESIISNLHGGGVGIQVGYNWEIVSNVFLGLEADYSLSNIRGAARSTIPQLPTRTSIATIDQLGTTRGKVGFGLGPTLFYGTAGIGYVHLDLESEQILGALYGAGRKNYFAGFVFGGGLELSVSEHWAIKAEFLRFDFGRVDQVGGNLSLSALSNFDTVRVGLLYRGNVFSW